MSDNEIATTAATGIDGADFVRPAAAYLASLSTETSRRGMVSALNTAARMLGARDWRDVDWRTLNAANVAALIAQAEGAPATKNKFRAALRGVARAAWRMGALSSDELARIEDVKPARGSREPRGRMIEAWELSALMRACEDGTKAGARDAALIAIASGTGMRRAELAGLMTDDVREIAEGYELRVIGKGNKERIAYVQNGASKALRRWLIERGDAPGALFTRINKGDKVQAEGMTTMALDKLLRRRLEAAELSAPIDWHDFRRTLASALLDVGEDISTVAGLLGHASVQTTARYDRRPAEARKRAARRVSVPYFGA